MSKSPFETFPPELVGLVLAVPILIVVASFWEAPAKPPAVPAKPPSRLEKAGEVVGKKAAEAGRGFVRGAIQKLTGRED